jgi:pyruvate formate lyase activating enzyme
VTPAPHPARYGRALDDGRIVCEACPRSCTLREGQRGLCFVRQNLGGQLVLTAYGRSSGFAIDPVEKKPLFHFFPGSSALSFGTAGCNLTCKFCQNWEISKSREVDTLSASASPKHIAEIAKQRGCRSIAFTYNDPVVFSEYAVDTADEAHARGVKTIAVTAGYVAGQARADLFAKMDAANVDLKAFTEDFYTKVCGGSLAAVLDTLLWLRAETRVWLEITTLVIPGYNDGEAELRALAAWVREHLGADTPLHFSAFHPDFRMLDVAPTPLATLQRARSVARAEGLRFVYTGNVYDPEGETTTCPACGTVVLEREGITLRVDRLDDHGRCPRCQTHLPGVFGPHEPHPAKRCLSIVIDA